jgi:hypothetical protein
VFRARARARDLIGLIFNLQGPPVDDSNVDIGGSPIDD